MANSFWRSETGQRYLDEHPKFMAKIPEKQLALVMKMHQVTFGYSVLLLVAAITMTILPFFTF